MNPVLHTYILQGNDGQEYTVEAATPTVAALLLRSKEEALSGYSVAQLVEWLKQV